MNLKEIYEIQIRKVSELSDLAKEEVAKKLAEKSERFRARFEGYAKISISKSQAHLSVDPIQGNIVDYFKETVSLKNIKPNYDIQK